MDDRYACVRIGRVPHFPLRKESCGMHDRFNPSVHYSNVPPRLFLLDSGNF
jgi:hypothetical protein